MSRRRLCVFGEVLFDHFPDGARVLGGAPFNVAWHLQAFGQAPYFISRVGDDDEGTQIRDAMGKWNMDLRGMQIDENLPTGRVTVTFTDGEPHYDIVHPCAYDAIALDDTSGWQLLYHGSLAVRSPESRATLERLRDAREGRLFLDVNLRPPWWDTETLQRLLQTADWVKLNADELSALSAAPDDDPEAFVDRYGLQGLLLTHGKRGAEAITADGERHEVAPQRADKVVDTVGAGDAFAAVFILGLLEDWPLPTILERAQTFASRIVGTRGATVSDPAFYRALTEAWHLNG